MLKTNRTIGVISVLCTILQSCISVKEDHPNLILVLVDDMGWSDAGFAGSEFYHTPNIDKLANEGVVFVNAYSASPVSSPSRGAIYTGLSPAATQFTCVYGPETEVEGGDDLYPVSRYGVSSKTNQYNEAMHRHALPRSSRLFVDYLRNIGYKSAFFGKWHCGVGDGYYPEHRGFETALGHRIHHISTKGHYVKSFENNIVGLSDTTKYVSEALTDECVKFIEQNKENPFVVVLSHYLVHTPLQGLPDKVEHYKKTKTDIHNNSEYAAMIESVDDSMGNILAALERLDIQDNTVIIFTSDNGGYTPVSTSNYPHMGGKSFPFEGGMRVPFILKHPKSTHKISTERVIGMDIFPTFLDAANIKNDIRQEIDGISLLPVIRSQKMPSRSLVFHFPHYTHATGPFSSVIYEDWKLIRFYNDEEGAYLLYYLAEDPYEQNDLSSQMPVKIDELQLY
ncbi:MAG: sulfatase [Bacteroidia bacterium]|nr:sulfatase [Bacteroidia bacterium]